MMNKFKTGQRVKILSDPCWHKAGKVGTIKCYVPAYKHWFVTIGDSSWPYYEDEIKLYYEPGQQMLFSFMEEGI